MTGAKGSEACLGPLIRLVSQCLPSLASRPHAALGKFDNAGPSGSTGGSPESKMFPPKVYSLCRPFSGDDPVSSLWKAGRFEMIGTCATFIKRKLMNKQLVLWAFVLGFVGGAIVTYIVSDQRALLPNDKAETKRMIVDLRRRISDELETIQ